MQQPQLLDKTVLPEYKSDNPTPTYDSIDQIEQRLIAQLIQLGYKYAKELTTEKRLRWELKKTTRTSKY